MSGVKLADWAINAADEVWTALANNEASGREAETALFALALSQAYERGQVDMRERAADTWESLRGVIAWLKENGKDDEYGVDEDTADTAKSIVDVLEIANAEPPTIWWHGGDAIVLNFDALGHMMTISGDSVHVHSPAIRSLPIDSEAM